MCVFSAFSTLYFFGGKIKIKMSEHAEVGGARKPGEGPQNRRRPAKPEKARKIRRRPGQKNMSLFCLAMCDVQIRIHGCW